MYLECTWIEFLLARKIFGSLKFSKFNMKALKIALDFFWIKKVPTFTIFVIFYMILGFKCVYPEAGSCLLTQAMLVPWYFRRQLLSFYLLPQLPIDVSTGPNRWYLLHATTVHSNLKGIHRRLLFFSFLGVDQPSLSHDNRPDGWIIYINYFTY